MKMRLRMLAAVFALLLLLNLTGCGVDTERSTAGNGSGEASGSAEKPNYPDDLKNIDELDATILLDGDQDWGDYRSPGGAFSDQGYYYVKEDVLHFWDSASGKTAALCKKADCLHAEYPNKRLIQGCEGFVSGIYGSICFWNGSLYYIDEESRLFRCDAAGNGRTLVCQLGETYMQEQQRIGVDICVVLEGELYYNGIVWEANSFNQVGEYIACVDLATGKEEILIKDCVSLQSVSSKGILFEVQERVDKDPSDQVEQAVVNGLMYWDRETKEVHPLFWKEMSYVRRVYGGKAHYTTITGKWPNYIRCHYEFNLETGEERRLEVDPYFIGGGYAWYSGGATNGYLVDMSTGEKLPCELKNGYWSIECKDERGCVVHLTVLTEGTQKSEDWRCYLQYSSLADGLQESDLAYFDLWTAT